jgi:hypothetical protein
MACRGGYQQENKRKATPSGSTTWWFHQVQKGESFCVFRSLPQLLFNLIKMNEQSSGFKLEYPILGMGPDVQEKVKLDKFGRKV